jgi:predicted TIM-barrel fold metal-dependent hydrolase
MKAVFLRPNIYNDRPWHDPYYDPLWAACQELNVPVGFHETTGSRIKASGADCFKIWASRTSRRIRCSRCWRAWT